MKNEQRFHLNRLASKLVTPERFSIEVWMDEDPDRSCPYDNPDCPNPLAPMGAGHHAECVERMTEVGR